MADPTASDVGTSDDTGTGVVPPGERGSLVVKDRAIERIAAAAALGVPGVVRHSGGGILRLTGRDLPGRRHHRAKAVAVVATDPGTGAVTASPVLAAEDRYGMLRGAASSPDGLLWVSTVNKSGSEPGPNDDRVVRIQFPAGGGGFD
ncbi:hypothetical protein NJ76_13145 [Rhodococcus sp. IITR03]|nr:hypothetical protein NJ76_13145 [Rhodococcus sp. IITR03]